METVSKNNISDKQALKIYLKLIKSLKKYTWYIVICILSLIALAAVDGYLYKNLVPNLINEGFVSRNNDFLKLVPIYILTLFGIRGIATFLSTYCMGYVGRGTVRDFRNKMLTHIMCLPVSFFQNRSSGELLSKINYDAEQVAASISGAISETLRGIFIFISLFIVMLLISWKITCLVFMIAPLLGIYFKYISSRMRGHSTNVQNTMGDVTQVAGEIIDGYKVVKGFGGQTYESNRVFLSTNNNLKQEMKMLFVTASSIPIMQFLGATALALLVYLATSKSINLSAGEFTGMFAAMLNLLRPIKQVASVNSVMQKGIAAANSIFNLLDEKPEENNGTLELKSAKGNICFKNVYFNYDGNGHNKIENINRKYILENLDFSIKPGEVIAIVGHSGAGKSTIASLIPRFYNVSKGNILLDGIDINKYKLQDLRRQISFVNQEVILFNDTIANNIAYGCRDKFSEEEIYDAAQKAYVTEFALNLPKGLDTNIGDKGVLLSGGQRQRIAIARAILKNSPILILDEATSALDTESEFFIQKALGTVMANRTTLVIAHRLSTIEKADQILVLEGGKIVEIGTHEDLMNKNSKYAKMHKI